MADKKKYNLTLAKREVEQRRLVLETLEQNELNAIFSKDEDLKVGSMVFMLRKAKLPKAEICKILSVDKRTLDRIYGTITYSQYLRHQIEEVLNEGKSLTETAPDDPVQAQSVRIRKITDKLNQILNGITPDKIFDADLKEISTAYKDLLSAFRLETGQSTGNFSVQGNINVFDSDQAKASAARIVAINNQIAETKLLLEKIDGRLARTKKKNSGNPPASSKATRGS